MNCFLSIIDKIFFGYLAFCTLYKLFFVIVSFFKKQQKLSPTDKKARIAVLFPVYKEGNVILQSMESFQHQNYPSDLFQTVIIADHVDAEHVDELRAKYAVQVLDVNFEKSSKAKSLNYAMSQLSTDDFDVVVILDVDNQVDVDFLENINIAYQNGHKAIQTHRVASEIKGPVALLDAITESINNTILRKGHCRLGLSASLIGSGMAFDAKLFAENVKQLTTIGEDKELELLLHVQKVHIHYLEDVMVYDQKVSKSAVFYKQRRRWMSSQKEMLNKSLKLFPSIYKNAGFDYFDKTIQWLMLPNSLVLAFVLLEAISATCFFPYCVVKWWIILCLLALTLLLATPRKYFSVKFIKALAFVPWLVILMFLNLLKLRKREDTFVHTQHE